MEKPLKAIEDVKRDMESGKIMDRLICGDVGYGKTEVAIRATFKAVMDSKQVILLVPTTVLAEQHYERFSERFKNYPVHIEILSRVQSKKEQNFSNVASIRSTFAFASTIFVIICFSVRTRERDISWIW